MTCVGVWQEREELAAKAVLEAARQAASRGQLLSPAEQREVARAALAPPPKKTEQAEAGVERAAAAGLLATGLLTSFSLPTLFARKVRLVAASLHLCIETLLLCCHP